MKKLESLKLEVLAVIDMKLDKVVKSKKVSTEEKLMMMMAYSSLEDSPASFFIQHMDKSPDELFKMQCTGGFIYD